MIDEFRRLRAEVERLARERDLLLAYNLYELRDGWYACGLVGGDPAPTREDAARNLIEYLERRERSRPVGRGADSTVR